MKQVKRAGDIFALGTHWIRLWEDMPDDPKWRVISRRSGRPTSEVIALFTRMLVNAGRSSERGTLRGWDAEDEAMALDMAVEDVIAIYKAMQGKVLDENRLTGWEIRQPKREDSSTQRVRALRERRITMRNAMKRNVTHRNATERTETQRNDAKRAVTPDKDKDKDKDKDISDVDTSLVNETVDGGESHTKDLGIREALRAFGEQWNTLASAYRLPEISEIKSGSERERHALARLREMRSDDVPALMARIRGSPYLRGEVNGFRCTFDWIVNATNYQKIMDGNYEDRKVAPLRR